MDNSPQKHKRFKSVQWISVVKNESAPKSNKSLLPRRLKGTKHHKVLFNSYLNLLKLCEACELQ
jgi:hypothetical protein